MSFGSFFKVIVYIYTLRTVCLSFFVSNKRQYGLNDRANIFCDTSHDPRGKVYGWSELKNDKSAIFCLLLFENLRGENAANRA